MDYNGSPRLTIILGAGASYDVANECCEGVQDWQPPLARQLFDFEKKRNFLSVLNQFPGAGTLAQELAPLTKSEDFDLEQKLREYSEHKDERVRQHFKEIPPYIRGVIVECCNMYTPKYPGCFTQLAKLVLADHPHQVLFLSLNYDTFLENALQQFGVRFDRMDDYTDSAKQAKLVKLHGSIDWFFEFDPPDHADTWHLAIRNIDFSAYRKQTKLLRDLARATRPWGGPGKGWLYPVLTAPLAGKGPSSLVCPREHLLAAGGFLGVCDKFLVIGTSGMDDDLFDLLRTSFPQGTKLRAHFVGSKDVQKVVDRYKRAVQRFDRGTCQSFQKGFRHYVRGSELPLFLAE